MNIRSLVACLCFAAMQAYATDISVVGVFPDKALLVIDGGSPKTWSVGNTVADGIKLVAVNRNGAVFDANGKRQTIGLGEYVNRITASTGSSITLQADGRGHFVVQGQINGGTMRMLVDTGASMVALSSADATRLGIDYTKGRPVVINTANGTVRGYQVKLDTVKLGDIVLNQVDGVVQEGGLPFALLGMSFLRRMEMRRDGEQMVLTKRF